MITLGDRIKKIRGNVTIRSFAESINVATSALQYYEADTTKPGYDVLLRIIKKYNVDPAWLLTGEESGKHPKADITSKERYIINEYRKVDEGGQKIIDDFIKREASRANVNAHSTDIAKIAKAAQSRADIGKIAKSAQDKYDINKLAKSAISRTKQQTTDKQ